MDQAAIIVADSVTYYHPNDEAAFFGWLDRMDVVAGYEGRGTGLEIRLSRLPTDDDLLEMVAFHRRYRIEMRQLAAFKTSANEQWFTAPGTYWHQEVFG